MSLAKRLKHLRTIKKSENSKITQEFVANLIGVARTTYTAYENGTKEPTIETLKKIAKFYGVSIDYIVGISDVVNKNAYEEITQEEINLIKTLRNYTGYYDKLVSEPEKRIRDIIELQTILEVHFNEQN